MVVGSFYYVIDLYMIIVAAWYISLIYSIEVMAVRCYQREYRQKICWSLLEVIFNYNIIRSHHNI